MSFPYYKGDADKLPAKPMSLPPHALRDTDQWEGYVADDQLSAAVNVALLLGQPLLLTGAPGTGKTQLAFHLSRQFGWGDPYIFEAKSTSTYRDLWYSYDALGRFHAKGMEGRSQHAADYIEYNALGKAILRSRDVKDVKDYLREGKYWGTSRLAPDNSAPGAAVRLDAHDGPKPSVVLIDEIDKAPRDFPNDILRELENLYFKVPEINLQPIEADRKNRPVVVITSNSEKNLPPAFLRRCTFFSIPTPGDEKLAVILKKRIGAWTGADRFYTDVIRFFNLLQTAGMEQRPGTAELLAWVAYLRARNLTALDVAANRQILVDGLAALAKSKNDVDRATKILDGLPKPAEPAKP